jgi:hypothetical protein
LLFFWFEGFALSVSASVVRRKGEERTPRNNPHSSSALGNPAQLEPPDLPRAHLVAEAWRDILETLFVDEFLWVSVRNREEREGRETDTHGKLVVWKQPGHETEEMFVAFVEFDGEDGEGG